MAYCLCWLLNICIFLCLFSLYIIVIPVLRGQTGAVYIHRSAPIWTVSNHPRWGHKSGSQADKFLSFKVKLKHTKSFMKLNSMLRSNHNLKSESEKWAECCNIICASSFSRTTLSLCNRMQRCHRLLPANLSLSVSVWLEVHVKVFLSHLSPITPESRPTMTKKSHVWGIF